MPATHKDFDFFFLNAPDFETWSWIFSSYKIFRIFFSPNYGRFTYYQLIMFKVSAKSENLFESVGRSGGQAGGTFWFWNLKSDFFRLDFFPHFLSKIWEILLILSSFLKKIVKDFISTKTPQFWKLKLNFCPVKKVFRRFSKIQQNVFIKTLFLRKN